MWQAVWRDPTLSNACRGLCRSLPLLWRSLRFFRPFDRCSRVCANSWCACVVQLTNACDFQIKVRQRTPCDSTTGTTLAIIQPGDSYTVVTDFLVEGGKDPLKVGDPWGEWVGSAGWRDLAVKLNVRLPAVRVLCVVCCVFVLFTSPTCYPPPCPCVCKQVSYTSATPTYLVYTQTYPTPP
mgnify:CR=1 FL=1